MSHHGSRNHRGHNKPGFVSYKKAGTTQAQKKSKQQKTKQIRDGKRAAREAVQY